jgi:hypothetical protein
MHCNHAAADHCERQSVLVAADVGQQSLVGYCSNSGALSSVIPPSSNRNTVAAMRLDPWYDVGRPNSTP